MLHLVLDLFIFIRSHKCGWTHFFPTRLDSSTLSKDQQQRVSVPDDGSRKLTLGPNKLIALTGGKTETPSPAHVYRIMDETGHEKTEKSRWMYNENSSITAVSTYTILNIHFWAVQVFRQKIILRGCNLFKTDFTVQGKTVTFGSPVGEEVSSRKTENNSVGQTWQCGPQRGAQEHRGWEAT